MDSVVTISGIVKGTVVESARVRSARSVDVEVEATVTVVRSDTISLYTYTHT